MPLSRAARASANCNDFLGDARPEHLQVVDALPRNAQGDVRSEILELVAINQLDLIDPLLKTDAERAIVGRIVAERRNLRDRFAFYRDPQSAPDCAPRARSAIAAATAKTPPVRRHRCGPSDRATAAPKRRAETPGSTVRGSAIKG